MKMDTANRSFDDAPSARLGTQAGDRQGDRSDSGADRLRSESWEPPGRRVGEFNYDVVIVGLGPTGLTLAHVLGQRGHSVLVLEREPQFYGNARAVYTDGECMRIFQSFGLAEELAAGMLQSPVVQFAMPDGDVFLQLSNPNRLYAWDASYFLYQPRLETSLGDALARYPNVTVQRGRELTRFEQDDEGVTVFHITTEGCNYGKPAAAEVKLKPSAHESAVRARYLIGCDGGRSLVRTQLGISMQGKSFPDPWVVVDIKEKVRGDGLHHLPYFSFICDPACPTVNCVQPDGHHRFEFMLMPGQKREYLEDIHTVRKLLARHIEVDKFEILRHLVYTFNALMAERWRERRVFLSGDAAHMTPQFVGQGMNAGVRDAYNLGWKLDAVLRGRAGDRLLDSYETERRPHAAAMTREAVRVKSIVSMTSPLGARLRNIAFRLALRLPVVGKFMREGNFIPSATYRRGTYHGLARRRLGGPEGRLMPQPKVIGPDGRTHRLDDLIGAEYALIGAGVDPRAQLSAEALAAWQTLGARFVVVYPWGLRPQDPRQRTRPEGLIEVEDFESTWFAWLKAQGHKRGSVAILRPDKYVFALERGDGLARATRVASEQLQRDRMVAGASPRPVSVVTREAA
ncbi:bifunctional 3-(3-hydroxy-phenyl)propionate/3-hydroxycinnamic acid hydroxylase [Cupriavidus sp. KK10]|jgi:3-(3-hydroxy-phenyl)propionate hydroxylase|uniref:bifunctional 3-(3-hydroxy-phenyl)propionate/3-hydroxycinnamic acid hydroxylase MhpA n=1 Tax=Cupriavidus sp. KK10 TaxID=1478019 RepID=UPI0020136615|nr:bifunctional 3-(3-hydroxy-phenyl)propionate/3-hydroxycinnamic acid hydroxylase [Cupriavidus sp. KK10]